MSRSDHGSSVHLTSPPYSLPPSKTHSMDRDFVMPTNEIATLNVLFLGGTNIGKGSIIDLVADLGEQKTTFSAGRRAPSGDVRSVIHEGKKITLYASSTSESVSAVASKQRVQEMLVFLRKNGGIHLLVYCLNASHPIRWIHEAHRTIASDSSSSTHIPAVAVIVGVSDAQQESWWSSNKDALAAQGPHFDGYTFIRMSTGAQSLTGDDISDNGRALRMLIFQNVKSETDSTYQRAAFYKQRSSGNSFQSLLFLLARKPSSQISVAKAIDIVLVGEIGVGKSSLINLIARESVAGVSSDTIGCTRTTAKYTSEEKGRTFHLHDTPGLVDPQMGDRHFVDPIDTIQQLIHSLGNGNGPDLILFCIDNSKPTAAFKRNFYMFDKFICRSRVPFALAVTKLEGGADQWWRQYGTMMNRRYGIDRSRYFGLEREKAHPDPKVDAEGQLRASLLSFLAACTDRQKSKAISFSQVRSSMERATSFLRSRASTPERTLMRKCGLEEETARNLVNRIVSSKNKVHTGISRPCASSLTSFLRHQSDV